MAKTVTTVTTVSLAGDNFGGAPLFSESVQNLSGNAPGSAALTTGFNSIAVPATALGVTIVPPPSSTVALTLKGITGDTGVPIDPANSTRLKWTAGQVATLGITAGAAVTVALVWS